MKLLNEYRRTLGHLRSLGRKRYGAAVKHERSVVAMALNRRHGNKAICLHHDRLFKVLTCVEDRAFGIRKRP